MKIKINKWTIPFIISAIVFFIIGIGAWFLPDMKPFTVVTNIIKLYCTVMGILWFCWSIRSIKFWSK